ncbi:MAG: nickel pincer cofactor biosynthesis protein LarC [Planctomycetota bacterium]|nr:MAG: nickel pincer cofactor biosynthesis protein LarC [Planctomycetota bacterium]
MKIAYLDMPSGIAGDMFLGALVDAGMPVGELRKGLSGLKIEPFELEAGKTKRKGFAATRLKVVIDGSVKPPHRSLQDVVAIISSAGLPAEITEKSVEVFRNLATAEAAAHGEDVEKVHLHETGAVDAMVDIVGTCFALDYMGIEELYASSFSLGTGTVDCAHGEIPVPAPATLELVKGFPVRMTGFPFELTTPTGAALVTTLAEKAGDAPPFRTLAVGIGAGDDRDMPLPNSCRLIIGETDEAAGEMFEIRVNVDDMTPEMMELAFEKCFEAGALDVWVAPIVMKKSRPGHIIGLIVPAEELDAVEDAIFETTTTFGLRRVPIARSELEREIIEVDTAAGTVEVKVGMRGGEIVVASPEYESVKKVSMESGVLFKKLYSEAQAAAWDYYAGEEE